MEKRRRLLKLWVVVRLLRLDGRQTLPVEALLRFVEVVDVLHV